MFETSHLLQLCHIMLKRALVHVGQLFLNLGLFVHIFLELARRPVWEYGWLSLCITLVEVHLIGPFLWLICHAKLCRLRLVGTDRSLGCHRSWCIQVGSFVIGFVLLWYGLLLRLECRLFLLVLLHDEVQVFGVILFMLVLTNRLSCSWNNLLPHIEMDLRSRNHRCARLG